MREEIAGCIVCDRNTARKIWTEEPEKRHLIYLLEEYIATLSLGNDEIEKIEKLKKNPKGFVYKRGMDLS